MANEHRGLEDLYTAPPRGYTDEQVRRIQEAPYGELMRLMSSTHEFVPLVEAMRRLHVSLKAEERAIKWLTVILVVLTAALLGLGAFEFWRH
jgi:hypothetical protein